VKFNEDTSKVIMKRGIWQESLSRRGRFSDKRRCDMRSFQKVRNAQWLLPLFAGAIVIVVSATSGAQGRASIPRVLSGPKDSAIPVPVANDSPGEKAPSALALLKTAATASDLQNSGDIECKGTMVRSTDTDADRIPITFVIGPHRRFQMKLTEKGGTHEVRAVGTGAKAQRKDGTRIRVDVSEFGLQLALPMQIAEIVGRADLSVRENEEQILDGEVTRVLTATLFPTGPGEATTASFYFDKATSQLRKVAMLTRTRGYRPLESLEVASYRSYKSVGGTLVPFEYEVTRDGQVVFSVHLDSASVTARHEDSFFKY